MYKCASTGCFRKQGDKFPTWMHKYGMWHKNEWYDVGRCQSGVVPLCFGADAFRPLAFSLWPPARAAMRGRLSSCSASPPFRSVPLAPLARCSPNSITTRIIKYRTIHHVICAFTPACGVTCWAHESSCVKSDNPAFACRRLSASHWRL